MTGDLLVIVPTRGRPHVMSDLWEAWQETTDGRARLLLAIDYDDPAAPEYVRQHAKMRDVFLHHGSRRGLAGTLNEVAVKHSRLYRMLGYWGDDNRPRTKHWDTRLVEALDRLGSGIAYGNDLYQGEALPTAVTLTSDIVTTLGYMAAPFMQHLMIDVAWRAWGEAMGRLTYLPDVVIEHLHPAAGKAEMDAGYAAVNSDRQNLIDRAGWRRYEVTRLRADEAKLRALAGGVL